MPVISAFFGILIFMRYNEHSPAHFHARYGEYEISVDIGTWIVKGRFPKRGLNLVLEWAKMHEDELMENWKRVKEHAELEAIEPLE